MSRYTCDEPCPFCKNPVEVSGSDHYPERGFEFKCTNKGCDYKGHLSCSKKVNCLLDVTKMAHGVLCIFYRNSNSQKK